MKLNDILERMLNKTYMYNTNLYKILSYKIEDNEVILVTDKRWFQFPFSKVNKELEQFLPTFPEEDDSGSLKSKSLTVINESTKQSIREMIYENIELLKKDPNGNLRRAKAINDQIKTMLDLAKLEISLIKMIKEK